MKNFIPLVNLPKHYEAYLYLIVFHHDKLMKYYFGYHEGRFESGIYKGSPKTHEEEFLKDLGKYDYKVYAIAQGTTKKMIFMENIMLNNLKKNNPQPKDYPILPSSDWKEFYNEATGGGAELKGVGTAVEDIQNGIFNISKEFNITPKTFFSLLYNILINSNKGPRIGPYILDIGKETVIERIKAIIQ